jgi:hypothetical protein
MNRFERFEKTTTAPTSLIFHWPFVAIIFDPGKKAVFTSPQLMVLTTPRFELIALGV